MRNKSLPPTGFLGYRCYGAFKPGCSLHFGWLGKCGPGSYPVGCSEVPIPQRADGPLSGSVSCRALLGEPNDLMDSVTLLLPSPGNAIQVTENIFNIKFIDHIY